MKHNLGEKVTLLKNNLGDKVTLVKQSVETKLGYGNTIWGDTVTLVTHNGRKQSYTSEAQPGRQRYASETQSGETKLRY